MKKEKNPEPLFTINRRLSGKPSDLEMDAQAIKVLRLNATRGRIEKAARASADWNNSDPFAYGRTALHVKQGWVDPAEAEKEFRMRSLARKAAKVKEVEDAKKH